MPNVVPHLGEALNRVKPLRGFHSPGAVPDNHCASYWSHELDDPFAKLDLALETPEVQHHPEVGNVHGALDRPQRFVGFIHQVANDEVGGESGPVAEEVVREIDEAAMQLNAVHIGGRRSSKHHLSHVLREAASDIDKAGSILDAVEYLLVGFLAVQMDVYEAELADAREGKYLPDFIPLEEAVGINIARL